MRKDLVILKNERAVTTNLRVAEVFEKQHKHVLRDIESLDCSQNFYESNFGLIENEIKFGHQGHTRKEPMYQMTRDGFTFLAMGYEGPRAAQFKEEYIAAFNAMEAEVLRRYDSNSSVLAYLRSLSRPELETRLLQAGEEATKSKPYRELHARYDSLPPHLSLLKAAPRFKITKEDCPKGWSRGQFLYFQFQRIGMLDSGGLPINGYDPFFVRVPVLKSGKEFTALAEESIDQLIPIFIEKITDMEGMSNA